MRRGPDRRAGQPPPLAGRIRTLVIEDNRLLRDGLARLLAGYPDIEVVAAVDGATVALSHVGDAPPHVVLLDAALANDESHRFLARLHERAPHVRAIIMDFVPARQDVTQFIEAGAKGFIMKDATADDVVRAIRTVAGGAELPLPAVPRVPSAGPGAGAMGGGGGQPAAGTIRLTKREQEIKELIAAGLGNKEIAQRLNIATNTVKSHVHNMLGKLATLTPPDRRSRNRTRRGSSRRSYRFSR
ncbi:MAG: LuxR C-terminal-related transcriptional regulator [Gemmatimonadales bacterium]